MSDELVCWRCGAALVNVILPMSRREECAACGADQHVCKLCRHYAPGRAGECDEERAEVPSDKESANFCDWFAPRAGAFGGASAADNAAAAELAALFGDEPPAAADDGPSESERAEAEFRTLFGD